MSKHARRPLDPTQKKPSIAECIYHRCERHLNVRQLNDSEPTGSECGACVAEELLAVRAQLLLALDGYSDRLAYSHALTKKLASARDRLNLLQPGAGDFIDDETEGTE